MWLLIPAPNINLSLVITLSVVILGASCTTFRGEYSDPDAVEIVDDKWNETDARVTAEKAVQKLLTKTAWYQNFLSQKQRKPVIVVGDMTNRTDEHIDTKALTEFVSDELINSGKVRFIDGESRAKILDEMRYQTESGEVKQSAARKRGQQIGADFLLVGAVSSSVHSQGKLKTVTYQTLMRLTSLETSEIIWSHKERIKKRFRRSQVRP
ncbi:MAG: penicillin-binding protein activator LpoB [Proteobacteria bacterium]|nr:penicillin-binding protein activator LpoB [Pseudomonadota bacterium]